MPLYEYECTACHRRIEKIQKFSDAELTVCPHCGGLLERTLTAPNVQFKGGGWYKDLYSSARPAAASGETSGSETGAAGAGGAAAASTTAGDGGRSGEAAKPSTAGAPASTAAAPAATSAPAASTPAAKT